MPNDYAERFAHALKYRQPYPFRYSSREEEMRIRTAAYMFAKRHGAKAHTEKDVEAKTIDVRFVKIRKKKESA